MILHAVVVPCDYHVTFRERILSLQNLFAKTLSIAKVFKNFEGKERKGRGRKGREKEEKWGGRREEERGEGRRK